MDHRDRRRWHYSHRRDGATYTGTNGINRDGRRRHYHHQVPTESPRRAPTGLRSRRDGTVTRRLSSDQKRVELRHRRRGITATGAMAFTAKGADGITATGADGITITAPTAFHHWCRRNHGDRADGQIFYVSPKALRLRAPTEYTATGADGIRYGRPTALPSQGRRNHRDRREGQLIGLRSSILNWLSISNGSLTTAMLTRLSSTTGFDRECIAICKNIGVAGGKATASFQ